MVTIFIPEIDYLPRDDWKKYREVVLTRNEHPVTYFVPNDQATLIIAGKLTNQNHILPIAYRKVRDMTREGDNAPGIVARQITNPKTLDRVTQQLLENSKEVLEWAGFYLSLKEIIR